MQSLSIDGLAGMLLGLSRWAALRRRALAGEILLSGVDLRDGLAVKRSVMGLGCVVRLWILSATRRSKDSHAKGSAGARLTSLRAWVA